MRHHKNRRLDDSFIGKTINNWLIIKKANKSKHGTGSFHCRCINCGSLSIKTISAMELNKTGTCQKCKPDYHFEINNGIAEGTLPSGHKFLIDEDDVERVSGFKWHKGKDYILGKDENGNKTNLHQFILQFKSSKDIIIDHINRNVLDCRKSNLRLVTQQQNSMNRSLQRNNKSGYVGVSYISDVGKYRAKIVLNGNHIRLGYSTDPVECAQMYNYASFLLFGEYASKCNDVPEASDKIKKSVEEKCLPYMEQALKATQRCSLF